MNILRKLGVIGLLGMLLGAAASAGDGHVEFNPVVRHAGATVASGGRVIVGFKSALDGAQSRTVKVAAGGRALRAVQAQTSSADTDALAQRAHVAIARARQLTPSMHLLMLNDGLGSAEVNASLERLRADPAVAFADVDRRRHASAMPDDPLYQASANATGQWYMKTPSLASGDAAATDAISAWGITTGSTGTVIADVDSGVRFDHPDLLRAGFGGRLLPGFDFVSEDFDRTSGAALNTYNIANDGDGWDPDPSDPGDWVSTAELQTSLFPPADCGDPSDNNGSTDSSWHGTRVMGVLGAVTNNNVGVAGMTWNPYILPVRALGKCGGYDSDIITGMQWAAGMPIAGVPDNPYPADIINLSLGGSGSCPGSYQTAVNSLISMGVLIVASAGNQSGPVDTPGNCSGVLAVAGLRNVGTKVGYSSLGPEVGIGAPAGNCVNSSGACLRSIDTTYNTGLTAPAMNSYTDDSNVNLGTSFSAPIVSGIAALMRAANANLTPAQLIARIKSSATAFPQPSGVAQCSSSTSSSAECACTTSTCGAGMINAFAAVTAAARPIAAVAVPSGVTSGSTSADAAGSAAACGASIASYAWSGSGDVHIVSGAASPQVNITVGTTTGTLTLTVTDSAGASDSAVVNFSPTGISTVAPASAGSNACPTPMTFSAIAPTLGESFAPATVATSKPATLTVTFNNANPFALTQAAFTETLPLGLALVPTSAPTTTCLGAQRTLTPTTNGASLSNAVIPAQGSCTLSMTVMSTTTGTYTDTNGANALSTGPAGSNSAATSAMLTVTTPASSGGGGALDALGLLLLTASLCAARRRRA